MAQRTRLGLYGGPSRLFGSFAGKVAVTASGIVGAHLYAFIDSRTSHSVMALTDMAKMSGLLTDTHKLRKALNDGRTVAITTVTDTHKMTGELNA